MTTGKRKDKTQAKADPPPAAKDDNKRLRRRNDNKSKIKRDGSQDSGLEGMWMKKIAFEWWCRTAREVAIFRFRATSAGATLSASGKRTLLDRKPAVTRAPKQQARSRLELYLQPRSAPLWFAQPARPRQGATRNFARTAVRIQ